MYRLVLILTSAAVVAAGVACGGSTKATPTAGAKLSVSGGALGTMASATMHTSPGASCTITYKRPSGNSATGQTKTAGPDGVVSWTWLINTSTHPLGQGTVTVDCGSDKESRPITISAALGTPIQTTPIPQATTTP